MFLYGQWRRSVEEEEEEEEGGGGLLMVFNGRGSWEGNAGLGSPLQVHDGPDTLRKDVLGPPVPVVGWVQM